MAMECKEFHPYPYQQFCIQHISLFECREIP